MELKGICSGIAQIVWYFNINNKKEICKTKKPKKG
jgi:hypothetical protein